MIGASNCRHISVRIYLNYFLVFDEATKIEGVPQGGIGVLVYVIWLKGNKKKKVQDADFNYVKFKPFKSD